MKQARNIAGFLLMLMPFFASGQYQSPPVWHFGNNAGIDFTGTVPQPVSSAMYTHSTAPATQCNANGKVLFYANSFRIWDRQGNPMAGSINPVWPSSYISSWNLTALIVPHPTDTNQYFVFQTFPSKGNPPFGPYFVGQLTYSLVDMTLNNGMGDVVSGKNHVLLDNNVAHYLVVVPGRHCNHWVIAQYGQNGIYQFKSYEVNGSGIDTVPVTSFFPLVPSLFPGHPNAGVSNRAGSLIYSYTRDKLIAGYESADITTYDFDRSSGKVSNPMPLTWAYPAVAPIHSATMPAICLSPDESQLYVLGKATSTGGDYQLRQFPLSGSGAAFSAGIPVVFPVSSQMLLIQESTGFAWQQAAMQLGPDQKIYIAYTLGQNFMGRIEQPDVAGTGCNFVQSALQLAPGSYTTSGLPGPMFTRKTPVYLTGGRRDTSVCFSAEVVLQAPDTSYAYYHWHNGSSGKTYSATESGMYVVSSGNDNCEIRNDTIALDLVDYYVMLGPDVQTCEAVTLFPATNARPPVSYLWSTGSTAPGIVAATPGSYSVTVTAGQCSRSDTILITAEVLGVRLPGDTTICADAVIRLDVTTDHATYLWQDGSTLPYYDAADAGVYSVRVTRGNCAATDNVTLLELDCNSCTPILPTVFSPNGDGRNDVFRPLLPGFCTIRSYAFRVYNRFGQQVYSSVNPEGGWNGLFRGMPAESGIYMYFLEYHTDRRSVVKGDVTLVR